MQLIARSGIRSSGIVLLSRFSSTASPCASIRRSVSNRADTRLRIVLCEPLVHDLVVLHFDSECQAKEAVQVIGVEYVEHFAQQGVALLIPEIECRQNKDPRR